MNKTLLRSTLSCFFYLLMAMPLYGQPVPEADINIQSEEFVNEEFCFTSNFTLSGDPGYGPYLRIMIPPGVSVQSMSFLGATLSYTKVGAFPASLTLEDPVSLDSVRAADGAVLGDTLFVASLPIGSVVSTSPDFTVSICVSFNDDAVLDSNYTVKLQPALEFGDTPTGDNGAITGTTVQGQSKPIILLFTKDNSAPEEERPPGPDWPYTYTLSIDLADQKTITGLTFTDVLPANLTWVGNLTTVGGVGCSANYNSGSRTVSATCTSVTGTENAGEVTVSFDVYIQDILDENNCTKDQITNSADFTATYGAQSLSPDSARDTVEVEHLSIQTTASPNIINPDDTVTYTTVFQFTDFDSTAGNLNPVTSMTLVETLPPGISFISAISPTISLSGGTTLSETSITAVVDTITGDSIRLTFDIHATTGDFAAGTAGTLSYKTLVRQHFDIAGTNPILARDRLKKLITTTYDLQGKASNCTDGSSATVVVTPMTPTLSILNAPGNGSCYIPQEVVTFKLTLTVPSGDTEGITFDNFFPLPVFDVSDLDTDNFGSGFDIRLAPDHSDGSYVPSTANITKDVSQNSVRIIWPDLSGPTVSRTLSLYIDLPIDYQPFDDSLYLSNLFQYTTENSKGSTTDSLLVVYLNICAPDIKVSKGITATDGNGNLVPPTVTNPPINDIENVDAGDEVTFVITAINTGGAMAYDVVLKDSIPSGVTNCALVSTDPLKYGDGTAVGVGEYSGNPFDAGGLTLDSLYASEDASSRDTVSITCTCDVAGSLPPDTVFYNYGKTQWRSAPIADKGDANQFDVQVDSSSLQMSRPTLTKTLISISPNGSTDSDILVPGDTVSYRLGLSLPEGETPALVVSDTLPEGLAYVTSSVSVDDGSFTGTVSTSPGVSTSGNGTSGNQQTINFSFGNTSVTNNNNDADNSFSFDFKAVVLDDAANSATGSLQEKINQAEITYTNLNGAAITASDTTELAEPDLDITLSMSPAISVDGGDLITLTITVDNNGTAPAYDITVTDDLDGLDDFFDLTTVTNTTGSMGSWVYNLVGSAVTYSLTGSNFLAAGGQQVFTFTAELDDNVLPNTTYETQASVSGDSEPGSISEQRSTTANNTDNLTTTNPSIAKSLNSISPDGSGNGGTTATAGDTLIYDIVVSLTEGTTSNLTLNDTLPPGFEYSNTTVVVGSFNGSVSTSPSVSTSGSLATGRIATISFSGNTVTTGDNNTSNNSFTVQLEAVVMDDNANDGDNALQAKSNEVVLTSSSISGFSINDNHDLNFAEPRVTINKWIDQDTLDAGDTLTIELRVRNQGTSMGHEIVATDTLDGDLFDLSSITLVNDQGWTYTYNSPVVKFTKDTLTAAEGRMDLEFKVAVKNGVVTGTTFSNQGIVTASTQTNTPPEERSVTRTNTESIYTDGVPSMVKSLLSSTDVNSSSSEAVIGEILTYQIAVTFPEGLTKENGTDPLLTDTLPTGFQYISSPSQSARISAVADYNGGEIITSIAGTINGTPVAITPSVSGSAATNQILGFNIGNVTNNDDQVSNDVNDEQLIITYEVLVLNTSDNNAGDSKPNYVSFQYRNGDDEDLTAKDTVTLSIQEPDLGLSTSMTPSGGNASGMNTVTFNTYVFNQNTSNSTTAYNLSFSDDLPVGFLGSGAGANAPVLVSATYTADGSDVSACFEWGGDGNELLFDASNGGCTLDSLNPGDSISLVYTAVIDSLVDFNETVSNNPSAEATSLAGGNGNTSSGGNTAGSADADDGERTGSAVNNTSGQAVNDLNASSSDNIVLIEPSLSKTGDTNLTIGDSTTMTITIPLPGGSADNFTVTDNLPAGLRYTGAGISFTLPTGVFADTPNPTTSADDDPVVWNFGTITNQNSSSQNLVISYEVEVRNLIGNQDGTDLDNTATLSYTGSSGADSLSDEARISVIEPNLTIEVEDGGGTYGAGSVIPYTIRIINSNNGAAANGVDFASVLPAELLGASSPFYDNVVITNTSGSVVLTGTATAVSGTDVSLGTSVNSGDQLSLASFDIPSNDTLIISFDATVVNNATAGGNFSVTASANYNSLLSNDSRGRDNSSNPGSVDDDNNADLNNYEESGSVTTNLSATVDIVKDLNSFHLNNDFTIGDSIIYDIKVALPEGVINNVVIVDSLHDGLGFISASRIGGASMSFSAAMTDDAVVGNAGKITFDLKNVTNTSDADLTNDTLTLQLKVQVLDDGVNNVAGNTQDNHASVTSSANLSPELSDTVSVDIVEPSLSISISPSNATPSLGEEVTFTVSVNNTGGAIAHDIDLASVLRELSLTYTGTFDANGSGFSINATDSDSLVFSADQLAAGGNVSFTFVARVDSSSTLDSTLSVGIGLTNSYDTQDGDPSSPWVERAYNSLESTTVTPSLHVIDASKTVAYTDANTNDQLDIGETLTYTVILSNNTGATANNVVFEDVLPANISYVTSSLTTTSGTVDESAAPRLSVDLGSVSAGVSDTISFQATVDGGTANGTLISNQGIVDSDQTEPEPTDVDGVDANGDQPTDIMVGPRPEVVHDIYAQKTVSWLTDTDGSSDVTATDVMRYTFILENTGTTGLTNVSLTDNIPAGLSLSASGTPTEGSLATGSFPNISWTGISLDVGEIVSVTLDVSIDAFGGASTTFTNQGSVDSDQTSPEETDGNTNPSDGNQSTSFVAVNSGTSSPVMDIEKRWVQTLDLDDDGQIDPSDRYRYTITIQNTGSAPATNVQFADAAPTNTVLAGDSVLTSQGIVLTETSASIEVNLGSLNPGDLAQVSFEVTPSGASDGDLIPNQASFTSPDVNSGVAVNSDDNADDADGINPTQTPIQTDAGDLDASDLTKTMTATSEGGSPGTDVLIGEVLSYEINIVVPKGNLNEASVIDTLPEGLIYKSGSAQLSRTFNTGLSASENPGGINSSTSGSVVSLTDGTDISITGDTAISLFLGDIINSDTDGTAEAYTLSFDAVVSNESGIGNDRGQSLTNDGGFSFIDGINQQQSLSTSSDPSVTIIESNVAIDQTASSGWILTAGGMLEYTLTITNPSGSNIATAYDVVVTDSIPFDADEWSLMTVESTNGTGTTGAITDNSDLASGRLNVSVDSIPAGESLTIVFRASADGNPELTTETDSMDNIAWVSTSSLPGNNGSGSATPGIPGAIDGERTSSGDYPDADYSDSDTTSLVVYDLDLSKSILNPQSYYAIGDTIEYQLRLAVPDGVVANAHTIEDALPSGVDYISGSLLNASGNEYPAAIVSDPGTDFSVSGSSADTLTLSLGNISNTSGSADTIVMTYWAWVKNDLNNQYNSVSTIGTELENFAQDEFTNPIHPDAAFTDSISDSATVYVGEPHLAITNTVTGGSPEAGGTMSFEVVVTNDGSNTAHEVVLSDPITTYLENISSLTITSTSGGASGPSGFTNNGTSWLSNAFDIPAGGSVTITFSADISNSAPQGDLDPNTILGRFSSQAGSSAPVERDSTNGGDQDDMVNLNNYNLSVDPSSTITVFPVELLSFTAEWKNNKQKHAVIRWETASELNNDYFVLQRSMDGDKWDDVEQIDGAGTVFEPQFYEYTDRGVGNLIPDGHVLYRLYQVDFDGSFSYSPMVELTLEFANDELKVWPNPFQDVLKISMLGKANLRKIRIVDANGKEVYQYLMKDSDNKREMVINSLNDLAIGPYYLMIELENGAQKLIKLTKNL